MKKCRLMTLLAAGLVLVLSGCKDTQTKVPAAAKTAASSEQEEVSSGQEEASSEKNGDEAAVTQAPGITITPETLDRYSDDGKIWLLHVDYDTVQAEGEGYEALAEGIGLWNEERVDSVLEEAERYAADAADYVEMTAEENYRDYSYFNFSRTLEAARVDDQVVSLVEMYYEYGGGAHGNYGYGGITFDAKTGERLELADLLKDAGAFREKATAYIIQRLEEDYGEGLFPDYAATVEKMWGENPTWYLDAAGITFIFDPYEVGSYAMGEARVTLPTAKFSEYLEEEYANLGFTGYAVLPVNVDIPVNAPLSSQLTNTLRLDVIHEDEWGMAEVSLRLNDSASEAGTFGRIGSAYLINTGIFQYVILDADYASDDYVTMVYNVSTGAVQNTDRLDGTNIIPEKMYGERMELGTRLDVLGTYNGVRTYTLDGKSGKLLTDDVYYRINSTDSPLQTMTTAMELPVVVDGKETSLPIGSRIRITGTDNEGTALFLNADTGEEGEIHYVRGDGAEDTWMIHIDGIPEQEYFEDYLPYAG